VGFTDVTDSAINLNTTEAIEGHKFGRNKRTTDSLPSIVTSHYETSMYNTMKSFFFVLDV
jgi:hypothetical protein